MKKLITLLSIAGLCVFMANCSSSKKTATAAASPAETVATINRNYTEAQFEEGKKIAEASCVRCHSFKQPETRTVTKLEKVLPSMFQKANLTAQQAELVRAYMLSKALIS
jgi:uncharacterized membrane protein